MGLNTVTSVKIGKFKLIPDFSGFVTWITEQRHLAETE